MSDISSTKPGPVLPTDVESAVISVRSQRQAMEYSLVLASQSIETTIEHTESGWLLRVPAMNRSIALESIRAYRLENRRWPWRREVASSGILFDWAAAIWVILVASFYWLSQQHEEFRNWGMMDAGLVSQGEWWRLLTAIWLHGDIAHLASNVTIGLVLLGFTLGRYGTGFGVLATYLAGFGGNLFSWLLYPGPHRSLGASGFVMGCLGLLAAQALPHWRWSAQSLLPISSPKPLIAQLLAGVLLFVLLGLTPGTDILAHLGGFLTGVAVGWPLACITQPNRYGKLNLLSALCFALLVVFPWWLALTNHAG